jgi:hypothetical protein
MFYNIDTSIFLLIPCQEENHKYLQVDLTVSVIEYVMLLTETSYNK